jgi:hypothetical protein
MISVILLHYSTVYTVNYTDEQHAMSSDEVQSTVLLMVEFLKMYVTR